jgi:hypothetical protein
MLEILTQVMEILGYSSQKGAKFIKTASYEV